MKIFDFEYSKRSFFLMEGVVLFSAPKVQITAMVLQQYTIKQTLLVTTTKYEKKI